MRSRERLCAAVEISLCLQVLLLNRFHIGTRSNDHRVLRSRRKDAERLSSKSGISHFLFRGIDPFDSNDPRYPQVSYQIDENKKNLSLEGIVEEWRGLAKESYEEKGKKKDALKEYVSFYSSPVTYLLYKF